MTARFLQTGNCRRRPARTAGYSLVELLLVIALMAILGGLSLMAFQSISTASGLQRGGGQAAGLLLLARQQALARGCVVECHMLEDGEGRLRSLQLFALPGGSANSATPLNRKTELPAGVMVLTNGVYSPLVAAAPAGKMPQASRVITFQPNGEPLMPAAIGSDATRAFFTLGLVRDPDDGTPPANFYTIAINPYTGLVNSYRP